MLGIHALARFAVSKMTTWEGISNMVSQKYLSPDQVLSLIYLAELDAIEIECEDRDSYGALSIEAILEVERAFEHSQH